MEAVHLAFGLPPILPIEWTKAIKKADHTAAYMEATQLAGFDEADGRTILGYRGNAPDMVLEPWPAEIARARFLEEFSDIQSRG